MSYNRNFLQMFFVATIACVCCDDIYAGPSGIPNMQAVSAQTVSSENASLKTAVRLTNRADPENSVGTKTLCPAGQYISKCGDYRIGFNWLKPAKLPYQQTDGNSEESKLTRATYVTRNYYIGDTTLELYEQMRTFFGHKRDNNNQPYTISYLDAETGNETPATIEELEYDRELILNNLCHPMTSTIVCTKCPNGANVDASTVVFDANNVAIRGSWDFYTIADCYINEFEDSTGAYFYISEDVFGPAIETAGTGANCYYTNTNPNALETLNGDEIGTFFPALNAGQTSEVQLIPSTSPKQIFN